MSRVALYRESDRASGIESALEAVADAVDWSTRRHVVVKPNLVIPTLPGAITHRSALRAVLQSVRTRYSGRLTVAEGCALEPTLPAFRALGFDSVAAEFDAQLVDLNADESQVVEAYDRHAQPMRLNMSRLLVDADCRISLALPKTHESVQVTLSIKNMVMGGLINRGAGWPRILRRLWGLRIGGRPPANSKVKMHQGLDMINLNLAILAPLVWPHLSIVDGHVAMEGDGPTHGKAVDWGIAVAGADPLAVDSFTARLMGYRVEDMGYLSYCAEMGLGCSGSDNIDVVRNVDPEDVGRIFEPHADQKIQLAWRRPDAQRLLTAVVGQVPPPSE